MREAVPATLAGERLDRAIALLTGRSRAEVAALIEAGEVAVDGTAVTVRSRRLAEGQTIEVALPPVAHREPPGPDPEVAFGIVHADDHVVVVDKPPDLVVHPGAGNQAGTLVHGLLARFPDLAGVGPDPQRPGIVHRLDAGTSGLLVVARTEHAWEGLVAQLAARQVERRYSALVLGHVEAPSGLVDAPIGRSEADPTRMAVVAGGREARTRYTVEGRLRDPVPCTLLACRLETGRTHQIRVHLAAIGHPVAGDDRYGGSRPALAQIGLERPFLHAGALAFDHPHTGERVRFASPLAADLEAVRGRVG